MVPYIASLPTPLLIAGLVLALVVSYLFASTLKRLGRVILAIAAVLLVLLLLGGG